MAVEADLLEFGAGNKGYPRAEVGVTAQVAPGGYSGMERQRSVTGPLLFVIYINDIDESVGCKVLKFANDNS